jgi:hypothetical protein
MSDGRPFDWTGVIVPAIIAAFGFGMAYWIWPDGVSDGPIASPTLREVVSVIFAIVCALFGVSGIAGVIKKCQ